MARRRRRKPTKEENNVDEAAAKGESIGESIGTETTLLQTEARPRSVEDELAIELGYADEPLQRRPVSEAVLGQLEPPATEPPAEEDDINDEDFRQGLTAAVADVLKDLLPEFMDQHMRRIDQRSRDRMHAVYAEATARDTNISDAIEEIQEMLNDTNEHLGHHDARLDRVEEACGLRPSLLTTTEAAVARLDEMAQGGKLKANDIRTIHRTLRAAVQEERARRQG
jgi:hypothetical protein